LRNTPSVALIMPAPIRTTSGPLLDVSDMEMLSVEWTVTVRCRARARLD
jgi:hypothetical protein